MNSVVSAWPQGPLFTESANSCVPVGRDSSRKTQIMGGILPAAMRLAVRSAGADGVEFRAEAVGPVDGGIAFAAVLGVAGRQNDPAADVGGASGECGERRADEVDRRDGRFGRGQVFGFHRAGGGTDSAILVEHEGGLVAGAGGPVREGDDGAFQVARLRDRRRPTCAYVEDGLGLVGSGLQRGERRWIREAVDIDVDRRHRAGSEISLAALEVAAGRNSFAPTCVAPLPGSRKMSTRPDTGLHAGAEGDTKE